MRRKKFVLKNKHKKVYLDVGCGQNKQEGYLGLDIRKMSGVDIVWDLEKIPYPIDDNVFDSILASHIVEHINPSRFGFVNVMNEWWRIMKSCGRLMIATPYGSSSFFLQDPTHCNPCNETTWAYFDPTHLSCLYNIYKPKPWKILKSAWHTNGNLEVIMCKIPQKDVKFKGNQVIVNGKWLGIPMEVKNS